MLRIASTFGVISPNSSRIGTITSRLIISLSAPKRWMIIAAEITDAETLTNSLPIRMVTISRRGSLRRRSMSSMRGFFAARIWSSWNWLSENSEVSVLEKKPEKPSRTTKTISSIHSAGSMVHPSSENRPPRGGGKTCRPAVATGRRQHREAAGNACQRSRWQAATSPRHARRRSRPRHIHATTDLPDHGTTVHQQGNDPTNETSGFSDGRAKTGCRFSPERHTPGLCCTLMPRSNAARLGTAVAAGHHSAAAQPEEASTDPPGERSATTRTIRGDWQTATLMTNIRSSAADDSSCPAAILAASCPAAASRVKKSFVHQLLPRPWLVAAATKCSRPCKSSSY
ncbi:MAG: hypothetical protein AW07_03987 [Candidatus Accumulibacter sp. SK-11]|nr:MAG: hypothetical protein AW07_03987 [Candidatus Accumulibacter sp. SK-11]